MFQLGNAETQACFPLGITVRHAMFELGNQVVFQ